MNIIIDRISTCNGWFVAQQTVRDEARSLGEVDDSALLSVVVQPLKSLHNSSCHFFNVVRS